MPTPHPDEAALLKLLGPEWRYLAHSPGTQTTPSTVTGSIRLFAKQVGGHTAAPVLVPVRPAGGKAMRCHLNALEDVAANGGTVVFGWVLWQAPGYLEAEFHSMVWRDEQLFCVTPTVDGEQQLLFVPDQMGRKVVLTPHDKLHWHVRTFYNVPGKSPNVHPRELLSARK